MLKITMNQLGGGKSLNKTEKHPKRLKANKKENKHLTEIRFHSMRFHLKGSN